MTNFAGLNLNFGDIFPNGYGSAFTHVNANHMRLMPWNNCYATNPNGTVNTTDLNTLKSVLDLAQSLGISVTIVLNQNWSPNPEGKCFVRGYPNKSLSYVSQLDKMRTDFSNLYFFTPNTPANSIGNHPAIHSWDLHNEPSASSYFQADPYKPSSWLRATAEYIRSVGDTHPISVGISNLQALDWTSAKLLDINSYTDIFQFHYYPQLEEVKTYPHDEWTAQQAVDAVTGLTPHGGSMTFADDMTKIRANNTRSLPIYLGEFGIQIKDVEELAHTDNAGQAAFYNAIFQQILLYPEIVGVDAWQAQFDNSYSIFNSDGTDRPSALVVQDFYDRYERVPLNVSSASSVGDLHVTVWRGPTEYGPWTLIGTTPIPTQYLEAGTYWIKIEDPKTVGAKVYQFVNWQDTGLTSNPREVVAT